MKSMIREVLPSQNCAAVLGQQLLALSAMATCILHRSMCVQSQGYCAAVQCSCAVQPRDTLPGMPWIRYTLEFQLFLGCCTVENFLMLLNGV